MTGSVSASSTASSLSAISAAQTQNLLGIAMMKQNANAASALADMLASVADAGQQQQQAALAPGVGQSVDIRA